MSDFVSEYTRAVLAQTYPLVRSHRDEIITRLELHLRSVDKSSEPNRQSELIAMLLADLLIKQAGAIAFTGGPVNLGDVAQEHASLLIEGRHYSRFGDSLVPVLRDVLGAHVPDSIASAWCDTFWAIVTALEAGDATLST